ncbi:MAG TPA: rhomboid family intramembrane serine protease [Spirochaetota bacterium]|nr:rhomboid family intramembrane serine protease [Spirochaetota bacterium]HPS86825.1 rhomboid family intramembrane serine protease [Spirochaetota bacterium]
MYQKNVSIRIGGPMTPGVKWLMIVNGAVFLIQQIAGLFIPNAMEYIFGISHNGFLNSFMIWQPFTYMFLHGGWMHIFFNLLTLWMFAGELEMVWGKTKFIWYYMLSGLGAGFFIALMNYIAFINYGSSAVTIGASGAIYAILLAYAILWPDREVLLYFLFPIKIKYLVLAFGLMEFFGTLSSSAGTGGNISHIGHLGGIISGFILIKLMRSSGISKKSKVSFFENFRKKNRLNEKKKVIDTRIEAKRIIDELLSKIAKNGMSSLTPDEKKKLEWARKHYYPSNDDILH